MVETISSKQDQTVLVHIPSQKRDQGFCQDTANLTKPWNPNDVATTEKLLIIDSCT